MNTDTYFNTVKNDCINECKSCSLEESAKGMFSKIEVIELFKKLESKDEAFSLVIDNLHPYLSDYGNIYVPGSGVGGLSRRISNAFPTFKILNVDSSMEMILACEHSSAGYNNMSIVHNDILNFKTEQKFDAIVAYGIMRYVPEKSRNKLVNSWHNNLKDDGVVIVGEGVAKKIIDNINPKKYSDMNYICGDAKLFRCSLFYHLFNRYHDDNFFQGAVDVEVTNRNKTEHALTKYTDVLSDIAGYSNSQVYLKMFSK